MRTHRAQIPSKQTSKTKSYIEGAWRKEKTTRRAQSPSIKRPSKRRGQCTVIATVTQTSREEALQEGTK